MFRNGTVRIYSRYHADGPEHGGSSAHVHSYATSVITNELYNKWLTPKRILPEDCRLTFDDLATPACITFEMVSGPRAGRRFRFEPVPGDEVGWSEMCAFALNLLPKVWRTNCPV